MSKPSSSHATWTRTYNMHPSTSRSTSTLSIPNLSPSTTLRPPSSSASKPVHPKKRHDHSPSAKSSALSSAISSVESLDASPPKTIADVLTPHAVSLDDLDNRYHSILVLVRALIGVVSNSDGIMEIFPPAFTTYNLLVPNAINMPFLLWGVGAPVDLVGMATYYAARSSQCAYCSLHTCNFALRRGVDAAALTGSRSLSKREAAVVDLALNMSSFPNHIIEEDRRNLFRYLSPANVEWIVLAIAMVGFLTTFMSSLGTDMEQAAIEESAELLELSGWTQGKHTVTEPENYLQAVDPAPTRGDTLLSNLAMLRHMPAAISYDTQATKKVPKSWPAIGDYLTQVVGHSFPVLALLNHTRVVRAIAESICLNLDAIVCGIEPDTKYLMGIVFAGVNRNRLMAKEFRKMTKLMVDYYDEDAINSVYEFSKEDTDFTCDFMSALTDSALMDAPFSEMQVRMLYIAKACAFAPTKTTQAVVDSTKALRPEHTVELICWISLLSFLQKLYIFYYPSCSERPKLDSQLGERAPMFTKIPRKRPGE
eukprot:GFKZ01003275.1.p1 GENE.GFKZ01003275.1~~GFKZ01003275.1.p1  ORF type:complete len:538 (-),score=72.96 GFKZ01003275.1:256-1869(-)